MCLVQDAKKTSSVLLYLMVLKIAAIAGQLFASVYVLQGDNECKHFFSFFSLLTYLPDAQLNDMCFQ